MDKFELQQLRDLPIEGVAERLGMEVVRHKALCPFHDDHHASLSFNVRRNSYRCFVCDSHGGTIDLVMKTLHKDFKEACEWLGGGGLMSEKLKVKSEEFEARPFDASRYERFFERPYLSSTARHFLFEERRLDERVVRWCRLTSWRDRNGIDWLQIPYYDREGKLIGIQNRNLGVSGSKVVGRADGTPQGVVGRADGTPQEVVGRADGTPQGLPRFRFPKGSRCGIYNLPVLNRLKKGEALYITEGASDCWAMLSSGHKAIAIPSATLLSKKDKDQLLTLHSQLLTEFHMYPDRDEPGERLFLQLQNVLPNLEHHQLPIGCKDYSDYYVKFKV